MSEKGFFHGWTPLTLVIFLLLFCHFVSVSWHLHIWTHACAHISQYNYCLKRSNLGPLDTTIAWKDQISVPWLSICI